MREIKFRLRFGNEVRGYEKNHNGEWRCSKDRKIWVTTWIPHTDKDQFTSSLDTKTGEEIYEKDICRQTFNHKTSVGEVRFSPSQGWLVGNWPLWPHDIEIIGNVFQNKDLLKE